MKCIGEQCQYCIPHEFNESCIHCTLQCRTFEKRKAHKITCGIWDRIEEFSESLVEMKKVASEINKVNAELNLS